MERDRKILELRRQLNTAEHTTKNEKKQVEFYEKQANEKKKPASPPNTNSSWRKPSGTTTSTLRRGGRWPRSRHEIKDTSHDR